jgi:curved DNA-binding protein CbpA
MATHYNTLGVSENASSDDINKAFRKLALKHHPNKGGDAEEFKKLSDAHDILEDAQSRREYNAVLMSVRTHAHAHANAAAGGMAEPTEQEINEMLEEEVLEYLKQHTQLTRKTLKRVIKRAEELDLFHNKEYNNAVIYRRNSKSHRTPRSHGARSPKHNTEAEQKPLSEEDIEFLQHLNNTRYTATKETQRDFEEQIRVAKEKALNWHPSYKKAVKKLSKLSNRRTRRRK